MHALTNAEGKPLPPRSMSPAVAGAGRLVRFSTQARCRSGESWTRWEKSSGQFWRIPRDEGVNFFKFCDDFHFNIRALHSFYAADPDFGLNWASRGLKVRPKPEAADQTENKLKTQLARKASR